MTRYLYLSILFFNLALLPQVKMLHLTFHEGCLNEIKRVAEHFNIDLNSIKVGDLWLDGKTTGNSSFHINHQRAHDAWELHKDYFNQFDAIITSDTAPLSRIFLQNNWQKPLIIYVCNRFDYPGIEDGNGLFPDEEYYEIFRQLTNRRNVKKISYTPFERVYAFDKGVDLGECLIKPCTKPESRLTKTFVPDWINKLTTFFIPDYENNTKFVHLLKICAKQNLPACSGKYNVPADLVGFKGIIHIPCALSNLALFENIHAGLIYFIPSKFFLHELLLFPGINFTDWRMNSIDYSEWYLPENEPLFVYFDSWQDLKHKIETLDFDKKRKQVLEFAQKHHKEMLSRWEFVFKELSLI